MKLPEIFTASGKTIQLTTTARQADRRRQARRLPVLALLLGVFALPHNATAHEPEAPADDFPTAAIADYVLACMAANGNSFESLHQCSCSIDFIKARMPYEAYERASTVMQVQMDTGQRGIFYRDSNWAKQRVAELQSLQAESTLQCF